MENFRCLTASEQVAAHLKECLARGVWTGAMPGEQQLLARLGVGQGTVRAALAQLEAEGCLAAQGPGCRRRITLPSAVKPPKLRLGLFLHEPDDLMKHYIVDLQHRLMEAGHTAAFAPKTLIELGMDAGRVARHIQQTEADAWVVYSGSQKVLEWFAGSGKPAFALAGRRRDVKIASVGPDKIPAMREAVRQLAGLGHQRIVLLAREDRRKPGPGAFERAFLEELRLHNISCGSYNLPDWENHREGFLGVLDALFRHSPPTALIVSEMSLFLSAQLRLAQRGILAPRDVSLICDDPDPAFAWMKPTVAHIRWDSRPSIRRILRWVDNILRGEEDRRQTFTKAEFVSGETMGPARRQ